MRALKYLGVGFFVLTCVVAGLFHPLFSSTAQASESCKKKEKQWTLGNPILIPVGSGGTVIHKLLELPKGLIALLIRETEHTGDLNNDGDTNDRNILHIFEPDKHDPDVPGSGLTNIGKDILRVVSYDRNRHGQELLILIPESSNGRVDIDGNGLSNDTLFYPVTYK